jgi:octaprenyl-diphosphate synthase
MTPVGSLAEGLRTSVPIEQDLAAVELWLEAEFDGGPTPLAPLLAHAARFRGKRVRAAQVMLVARACGRLTPEHRTLAGVIELIHAATLAHDDVLDEASARRGLDCLHVLWGAHAAVLLGDWLYARAFTHCTRLEDQTASRVLARATARMCAGEIHQNLTRRDFELAETDYLAQVDGKTGALFEAAGRLAAHYAGASPALIETAARHGLLAGRAFQIADDLLDLEGDPEIAGKSLGTDWERGKMTLPLIRLREALDPARRARLAAAFLSGASRAILREADYADSYLQAAASCRALVRATLAEAAAAAEALPAGSATEALSNLTRLLGERSR